MSLRKASSQACTEVHHRLGNAATSRTRPHSCPFGGLRALNRSKGGTGGMFASSCVGHSDTGLDPHPLYPSARGKNTSFEGIRGHRRRQTPTRFAWTHLSPWLASCRERIRRGIRTPWHCHIRRRRVGIVSGRRQSEWGSLYFALQVPPACGGA